MLERWKSRYKTFSKFSVIDTVVFPVRFTYKNVFILSRKYEVSLKKQGTNPNKNLKAKNYVYNLEENTLLRKEGKIDTVLTRYVENVGRKGEIVSLNKNIAYKKLLLPGYGEYATNAINPVVQSTGADDYSSPYAQRTINILKSMTIAVVMNKDIPWVIEPWHIRVSLRKIGIHCKDECITLIEPPIKGPNLEIENKKFFARIKINSCEEVDVKCCVHHWSTDPTNRLPYVFEHWKQNDSDSVLG